MADLVYFSLMSNDSKSHYLMAENNSSIIACFHGKLRLHNKLLYQSLNIGELLLSLMENNVLLIKHFSEIYIFLTEN